MTAADEQPVVLDTNVVSELARPEPDATVVGELRLISERSCITAITLGELRLGVELLDDGHRKRELLHHVHAVRDAYRQRTLPLGAAAMENYAVSVATMRRQGTPIPVNDAYIAAITVIHGAVLYTRNLKDFQGYPDLQAVSPWEPRP